MEKNSNQNAKLVLIWVILRFPIFLIIACVKIFIATPIEFIFKLFFIFYFVLNNQMKYKLAIMYQNYELYRSWMDECKRGLPNIFPLDSFDFKEAVNFLKFGKLTNTIFKIL
jgi:hypothetical protein